MYKHRQSDEHGGAGDSGAAQRAPGKSTLVSQLDVQRAPVQRKGGVGEAGDVHERHADAVADRVVRGESAAPLLDALGSGGGGTPAVQRALSDDDRQAARANAVDDVTMEQLAHRLAYHDGNPADLRQLLGAPGQRTPTGEALDRKGFDCDRIVFFSGAVDLQYWALPAKEGADVTPVIAFRGTTTAADRADDTNRLGVGMGQFLRNQARIRADLGRLGGRGVIATGHSLGGALAQIAACFYPDLIVNVVTFQSLGISRDTVERLRDNPGAVTAHHHRVHGDVADDTGEAFVPGAVTEWGTGGRDEPRGPVNDHNSFPLLSSAGAGRAPWMQGASYPGLARHRDGTTDDAAFGRPLRGIGEPARTHPGESGAIAGGVVGGILGGPIGAIIGAGLGGGAAGSLRGDVAQDETYGAIWLALLARAEAGDTTPWRLEQQYLAQPCRQQNIGHLATSMYENYAGLFPEYAILAQVIAEDRNRLSSPAALIAGVRGHGVALDEAAIGRLTRVLPLVQADPPSRVGPPGP